MKRIKRISTAALATALGLAAMPALGQAVKPASIRDKGVFDQLYRSKLTAVQRTRATDDDRELYQEMLVFAGEIPDEPGVQGLIYSEVIPLAAAAGDIPEMLRAAARIGEIWPGHPLTDKGTLAGLADRAYRGAARDDRERIGEPYIELLLDLAQQHATADDYKQALSVCKQAGSIARAIGSDQHERVAQTLDDYSKANSTLNRIEMLKVSVERNPQNSPAARELVELLIVRRNDPANAAEFAELAGDPELAELVALSALGTERATAAAALRVGDWYNLLAQNETDYIAKPLLESAAVWYARFLEEYPRRDTLAIRVNSMNTAVLARLRRIDSKLNSPQ